MGLVLSNYIKDKMKTIEYHLIEAVDAATKIAGMNKKLKELLKLKNELLRLHRVSRRPSTDLLDKIEKLEEEIA